ncbi:MAG: S-layer protein [Methanomicrobia archaeon]|nr:S-layer protein [Methanomicrobia archaeon]
MRVKKIGAILAGAVMIGSAVAAAWDPANDKDFFVDSETGEPNAIVVVGANAAAMDVTAGAWVAAQIGSMAYYEDVTVTPITGVWSSTAPYTDDQGDNYIVRLNTGANNADVILLGDTSGYFNIAGVSYPPYAEMDTLWWEDWDGNDVLDEYEKREEIYVNLTHDWQYVLDSNGSVVYSIYPIVPAGPVYGYEYRVILEHFPETIIWTGGQFNWTPYYLYESANNIKFLCDYYDLLGIGWDADVGNYVYYGTPHWSEDECRGDEKWIFHTGETKNFYGWEITLDDVNIYEFKAQWLIKGPNDEEACEYVVVVSSYWPDVGFLDWEFAYWMLMPLPDPRLVPTDRALYEWLQTHPGTQYWYDPLMEPYFFTYYDGGYPDREYHETPDMNFCYSPIQDKMCEYDVIGITDDICDIEDVTIFALDTVKIFVGAEGNNKAVARLYALEDYGIIHDAVCIQPCGPEGYQWRLDIVPSVEIEYGDYIGTYYCPTIDYDDDDTTRNDGIPDYQDGVLEAMISLKLMNVVDIRVCGSSQTIPLCCWDMPQCGVDDYWVNTGDAQVYIELMIDDADDLAHTDLIVQGGFSITHYAGETVTTEIVLVDIDPMSIVVNDDEVTDTMKATSNLVLVGGPGLVVCVGATPQVANTLTQDLVDQGLSVVDWATSTGEYEYVADAFAEGKDVVIVAGADRDATRHAVELLLNDLMA